MLRLKYKGRIKFRSERNWVFSFVILTKSVQSVSWGKISFFIHTRMNVPVL